MIDNTTEPSNNKRVSRSIGDEKHVITELKEIVGTYLGVSMDILDIDENLGNLGVDSVMMMGIMDVISKKYGLKLSPTQVVDADTILKLSKTLLSNVNVALTEQNHDSTDPGNIEEPDSPQIQPRKPSVKEELLRFVTEKYGVELNIEEVDPNNMDQLVSLLTSKYKNNILDTYQSTRPVQESKGKEPMAVRAEEPSGDLQTQRPTQEIAIIGMSVSFPDADNPDDFWRNLINGKSSIREIPEQRWNWRQYYTPEKKVSSVQPGKTISKWGAFIDHPDFFDPLFFGVSPKEAKRMDPQERMVLQESYRAIEDAGLQISNLSGSKTGVFIGYEYSGYLEHYRRIEANENNINTINKDSSNPSYYLANRVSYTFDFRGPSEVINLNCASSAVSINRAFYSLLNYESDLALAGGVCLNIIPEDYEASNELMSPDGSCRVFDEQANGYTKGEGCGIILLKRLEDAQKDGDRIYALIKSCSQISRGRAKSLAEVKPDAISNVIKSCHQRSQVTPDTVHYMEVDGYCTKWSDSLEYDAIKQVFSESGTPQFNSKKHCGLGSLKGNIGHLEPASGVASVIKVALSMSHRQFPATITCETINEFIDVHDDAHPLYLMRKNTHFSDLEKDYETPVRAGINSFANSGVNVHILLEEYRNQKPDIQPTLSQNNVHLIVLSAKNNERLIAYTEKLLNFLQPPPIPDVKQESKNRSPVHLLADMAYTLQVGRDAMECRLAIVVQNLEELIQALKEVPKSIPSDSTPEDYTVEASVPIFMGNTEAHLTGKNLFAGKVGESVVNSLLEENDLEKLAIYWIQGGHVPWERLHKGKFVKKISLPTYPFLQKRFWLEFPEEKHVTRTETDQLSKFASLPKADEEHDYTTETEHMENLSNNEMASRLPDFLSPVNSSTTAVDYSHTVNTIRKIVEKTLELDEDTEIQNGTNFAEMGFTSITIVGFAEELTQKFNLTLPETIAFDHPNIRDLAIYLVERLKQNNTKEGPQLSKKVDGNKKIKTPPTDFNQAELDDILLGFEQKRLTIENTIELINKHG